MSIKIEKFLEDDSASWDEYISKADNGTIFHSRKFLSYHPDDRFVDHSLIFKTSNKTTALFPAIELELDKDKTLYSHRGSSFGGFVYRDLGMKEAFLITETLKDYARKNDFSRIIITLPPITYMSRYSNYFDLWKEKTPTRK